MITGVEILTYELMSRGFIDLKRLILFSYGFMPLLIPMGIVIIVFKYEIRFKNAIMAGSVLNDVCLDYIYHPPSYFGSCNIFYY